MTDAGPHNDLVEKARQLVGAWTQSRFGWGAVLGQNQDYPNIQLMESSSVFHPPLSYFGYSHCPFHGHRWLLGMTYNEVLIHPDVFRPQAFWALFWALGKAEHRFVRRFIPSWSHEERLSGHFISQIAERIEEFSDDWSVLSQSSSPRRTTPHCSVFYADTATSRQEGITGSDFSLIVHMTFLDGEEFFKVARFQVKKVTESATAEVNLLQLRRMREIDNLGYYLFYYPHKPSGWTRPPTVVSANVINRALLESQPWNKQLNRREPLPSEGRKSIKLNHGGFTKFDFASFVTFSQADIRGEHGVLAKSAIDAVRTAWSGPTPDGVDSDGSGGPPRQTLVITLGKPSSAPDWDDELRVPPNK